MIDPFQTLGVEARFDLDPDELARRHRDLSRALHPDRYAGAPAAERRLSLSRAIEVNDAFRVLKDPIRRAEALLRRAGVPVGETAEPKPSPDLLMEMMERREELGDARRRKDLVAVRALTEAIRVREREVLASMGRQFAVSDPDSTKLAVVLPELGELRYLRRFLDEASAIEEELTT
ncbi:Fe-S protein assembly co-chaperone HscB [Polyangium sp. 6x1]|uniref:Fe-S protein assembly co-chaperone HscB n=1 Tax=Polyangium sp. 6x1 TaxID=3042689 RepID=UPI002482294D|nr:Fe-S protein assembly co-chaperone HscB [Polyangium sp. 6x1]MDI1448096.1 Fe-S protein assembly co-chaperone HscB [Polyangium sp. 6x1]